MAAQADATIEALVAHALEQRAEAIEQLVYAELEERGVSVAIAAELVGHSRITTTQAVYTRMRGGREAKLAAQRAALRTASS